jgi:hypothetical protein
MIWLGLFGGLLLIPSLGEIPDALCAGDDVGRFALGIMEWTRRFSNGI